MRTPFGLTTFLGIASLIGVIVSHVIVLFDFVEEKCEEGEPLPAFYAIFVLDLKLIRWEEVEGKHGEFV